jgi:hypothetical protein
MPSDTLEQEWNESHLVSLREICIDLAKRRRVVDAIVRRRFHARKYDRDAARLGAIEYRGEILFKIVDRQSAQSVIRAERDDQHAHVAVERPVKPPHATCGRIA